MSRLNSYYINENIDPIKFIKDNVSPKFLKINDKPFYRSTKHGLIKDKFRVIPARLEDREPKDTKPVVHDYLNSIFKKMFGWPVRNGVFAVRDYHVAQDLHPDVYFFYPLGDFEYCYHPKINDLIEETFIHTYGFILDKKYSQDEWYKYIESIFTERLLMDRIHISFPEIERPYKLTDLRNLEYIRKLLKDYIDNVIDGYKDTGIENDRNYKTEVSFRCKEYILSSIDEHGHNVYGDRDRDDEDDY
jgi:hypothetical protein